MLKLGKCDFGSDCLWKQHPGCPPAALVVKEARRHCPRGAGEMFGVQTVLAQTAFGCKSEGCAACEPGQRAGVVLTFTPLTDQQQTHHQNNGDQFNTFILWYK